MTSVLTSDAYLIERSIQINMTSTVSLVISLRSPRDLASGTDSDRADRGGIDARTRDLVGLVRAARSDMSRSRRVEDLSRHLQQYPESINLAFMVSRVVSRAADLSEPQRLSYAGRSDNRQCPRAL